MEIMRVRGSNLPNPGKCARCGSVKDGVDLGFDIEDDTLAPTRRSYGRFAAILCDDCFNEAASIMGYVKEVPVQVEDDGSEETLREVRLLVNDLYDIVQRDAFPKLITESGIPEAPLEAEPVTANTDSGQGNDSAVEQGSDDVSSDTSDEYVSGIIGDNEQ